MRRASSVVSMLGILAAIAFPAIGMGVFNPSHDGGDEYVDYACARCRSANPGPGDVVASGSTANGPLSALPMVPEMSARCANSLGQSAPRRERLASHRATATGSARPPANYTGMWWASPAGSESGWGISLSHQGSVILATWFTYDATGKAWWLSMTATRVAPNRYEGTLFESHGPAYNATSYDPSLVTRQAVGSATLCFTSADAARFSYTVNGVSQTKPLVREVFADPVPVCTFGVALGSLLDSLAPATFNRQGLWWAWPAGSEPGWGVSLAQQGGTIIVTVFTHDLDGSSIWFSGAADFTIFLFAGQGWAGTLYRTTGPPFSAVPFDPAEVAMTAVGTFRLRVDGDPASFEFEAGDTSSPVPVSMVYKLITPEVFVTPGTSCQ